MKAEDYIKQINASVDILSAQIGNARIREMWRKDIKTRLSRLNGFISDIQWRCTRMGEDEIVRRSENKLTMEGIHDHDIN